MKKEKNPLVQSLNGQWEFSYSKNVKSRPVNFYEETFDASGFDKIKMCIRDSCGGGISEQSFLIKKRAEEDA